MNEHRAYLYVIKREARKTKKKEKDLNASYLFDAIASESDIFTLSFVYDE